MDIQISDDEIALGEAAGKRAAQFIRKAIDAKGNANIILATGISQFETLQQMISFKGIDWSKVQMFHLDEYIGLAADAPASFRNYLNQRFVSQVPALKAAYLIDGETDPHQECERLGMLIRENPIDVALIGIGENGHLAFNDPPADFDTDEPYIIVELDEACRKQQVNESWFATMDEVPRHAISMSVRQILRSTEIICSVPGMRKAVALRNCFNGAVSPLFPASILQQHPNCHCYLDKLSASLLEFG